MKKYIVVSASNETDLEKYVNEKLDEGYICQGGISVMNTSTSGYARMIYSQAMLHQKSDDFTWEEE